VNDTYENLPTKVLEMMSWVAQNIDTELFFKTDDDVSLYIFYISCLL
jgi:hypothetical protein